jgi:hypothetical protein
VIASVIGGLLTLLIIVICGGLSLAGFAFWIWMLVHAISNKGLADGERIVWVLVIIFLPLLGSILYFFLGRPKAT